VIFELVGGPHCVRSFSLSFFFLSLMAVDLVQRLGLSVHGHAVDLEAGAVHAFLRAGLLPSNLAQLEVREDLLVDAPLAPHFLR
jgi:hypothetical protein